MSADSDLVGARGGSVNGAAAVIPQVFRELLRASRWVAWRIEIRGGRATKVPISPVTGCLASSTDPATWGTLEEATHIRDEQGLAGVGIVLGEGLGGVDLDGCRDPVTGELAPWAKKIITAFGSYAEVSPSGTGVKILAFGAPDELPVSTIPVDTPPINGKRPAIECYVRSRYFAITGQILEGVPDEIIDCRGPGGAWDRMVRLLRKRGKGAGERRTGRATGNTKMSERLRTALASDRKLRLLWESGKDDGTDRSRNDAAVAATLALKGFEDEDIEAAIRSYPLGQIGQGALTSRDADRQIGRLLRLAAKARERRNDAGLTDTGNAARLIALHGQRLRHIPPWRKWIVFDVNRGRWVVDHGDVLVRELAKDVGRELKVEATKQTDPDDAKRMLAFAFRSLNAQGISGMVDLARGIKGIPLDHEKLDADAWLLGVENGVIDLRTGELRAADPADLMFMQCPVLWDENARAPRFGQAMEEWFPDPEVRAYVHRVAGSALVGAQRDHVFIIHYGFGGNGKGTFTRALQRVLGPYAIEIHLSLLVETRYREHDTVRADLFRKRLAIAVETERRIRLAEASVKNLTGGDRIRARRMREDPWSFDPTHSLWLQTNHLPGIAGRDAGIWRRIRVVNWSSKFEGKEADQNLDDTLATEAAGILRWLVEGCLASQREGLAEPGGVINDTLAYRQKEDVFSRFASDVGLVFRPGMEIQAGQLQALLGDWAEAGGRERPEGIADWLAEKGARRKQKRVKDEHGKGKRDWFWVGTGLDDAEHESEQPDGLA